MRFVAWVGGLLLVAVVGAALASAARPSVNGGSPLLVAQRQGSEAGQGLALPGDLFPSPSPTPPSVKGVSSNPPARPAPVPTRAPTKPSVVVSSRQQALINQDRAAYHLAPLTWSSCLAAVARAEAAKLATPGVAFRHYDGVNRDLTCHLGRQVGENIGWYSGGVNDPKLNSMFMASPDHKANILGPYRYVATAWAVRASDGVAFIAVEFG
jgi:uncharacterized protein YkwD